MSQQTKDAEPVAAMMHAKPEKQHRWLESCWAIGRTRRKRRPTKVSPRRRLPEPNPFARLAGCGSRPRAAARCRAAASPATSVMTIGYDPQKKRFVGSWFGSMMTHFWVYDGELDAAERVLTLNSDGPSMSGDGTLSKYQDEIEFKNDDLRTLTARVAHARGHVAAVHDHDLSPQEVARLAGPGLAGWITRRSACIIRASSGLSIPAVFAAAAQLTTTTEGPACRQRECDHVVA